MARTKTVYMLRVRLFDDRPWEPADEFPTRKQRDRQASFNRIVLGLRTHSYEERRAIATEASEAKRAVTTAASEA